MNNYNCKRCGDTEPENFYKSNGAKTKCKKCHTMEVHHRKRVIREDALQELGGCCSKCGYNKSIWALEMHHIDPELKDFNWGNKRTSFANLIKELDKCVLICSNCHREEHENEWKETLVEHHPYYD